MIDNDRSQELKCVHDMYSDPQLGTMKRVSRLRLTINPERISNQISVGFGMIGDTSTQNTKTEHRVYT